MSGFVVPLPLLRAHVWDDQAAEWHTPSGTPQPHSHLIVEDQPLERKDRLARHIERWHEPEGTPRRDRDHSGERG